MKIRALSVWNPWAYLLVHGPKTVETRAWATLPTSIVGGWLAIHASKHREPMARWPAQFGLLPNSPELVYGAVIGYGLVDRVSFLTGTPEETAAACCTCHGTVGIHFSHLTRIPPLYVRGRQGFFYVDLPAVPTVPSRSPCSPCLRGEESRGR